MKHLILLTITILSCLACSEKATQTTEQEFLVLNPVEFNQRLSQEDTPQLIDVRTKQEFDNGSIEHAQNYDFLNGDFQASIESLDQSKTVFVFCAKGGRSGKAATLLKEKGFRSIIDLKGGYSAWSK